MNRCERHVGPHRGIAGKILLTIVIGLVAESPAQELSRLPPISTSSVVGNDLDELRSKVRELETTLASVVNERGQRIPDHSTASWQPPTPNSSMVKLAGFAGSMFSGNSSLNLGGYVKADLIHDFNAIGSTDVFDPLTIPTDGRPGENTRLHARQTRLNLDFRPDSRSDDLRLFVEGDFFGTTNPFRRGRAFFRLRHAYIRAGRLLTGQTWSTFMDESILPSTLDFESPRSVILDRRALVRWTESLTESLDVAVAVEDPRPVFDLDSAPAGNIERPAPDLIARLRYDRPCWHLQSAGVVRLLRYREASRATDDAAGWGHSP